MSSSEHSDEARPRNTRLGEFWFGRLLTVATFVLVFVLVILALVFGVRGADLANVIEAAIGAWLLLTAFYQVRALGHDRLADVIRSIRGR